MRVSFIRRRAAVLRAPITHRLSAARLVLASFVEPVTTKHGQTFEKEALLQAVRAKPEVPSHT